MRLTQPKPYMDAIHLRRKAYGTERRRNLTKIILEKGTQFPQGVELSDIDKAFTDFVDQHIDMYHDGKRLPTYRLFSNQRISEYSQTWSNLDEHGNIQMNFKTVTRESNPQKGDSQGGNFNVPGFRDYSMFVVPSLQENGEEAMDLYTMKQPTSVNLMYKVAIVTNRYSELNDFNTLIHVLFSGLQYYISPNGHYMPMTLESVSDESVYDIDDRKYYSQSCQIKVLGYIVRRTDFKVTRLPSRISLRVLPSPKKRKFRDTETDPFCETPRKNDVLHPDPSYTGYTYEGARVYDTCPIGPIESLPDNRHPSAEILDDYDPIEECRIDDHHYHKRVTITVFYPTCDDTYAFIVDSNLSINSMRFSNVACMHFKVNGEEIDIDIDTTQEGWLDFEPPIEIYEGDEVEISIERLDGYQDVTIELAGFDRDIILDDRVVYDTQYTQEDVYLGTENVSSDI